MHTTDLFIAIVSLAYVLRALLLVIQLVLRAMIKHKNDRQALVN